MFPLAHIGVTVFLAFLFYLPLSFAFFGAMLPDFFDKIFFIVGIFPCGRFFGHSLFFGPILALVTYAITRKKVFALAILFGAYLHLLQDVQNFIPWFYPLVNYDFICPPVPIQIGLFEIVTESIGAGLLIFTLKFKSKLIYLRERLLSILKK